MADFLPRREDLLLAWSGNFSRQVSAAPAEFGLTPEQADAYAQLHEAFAAALAKTEPQIRSMVTVAEKNAEMGRLKTAARQLAMLVKGTAHVTAEQRLRLGINPGLRVAARQQVPTAAPVIAVERVRDTSAMLRLQDSQSAGLGKPARVHGAMLFTFVGDHPPTGIDGWNFHSSTTACSVQVDFSATTVPGQLVWFTACWLNARLQPGPWSPPRPARLPGTGVMVSRSLTTRVAA